MNIIKKVFVAPFLLLALVATSVLPVFASSHREAPSIGKDPVADATDVYAFVSPDKPDTVTLIANFLPFEEPAGGPNFYHFGDDVLYTIKVDNDADAREDISYEFRFNTKIVNPKSFLQATGEITSLTDPNLNIQQSYTLTKVTYDNRSKVTKKAVLGTNLPVAPSNVGPKSMPNYAALSAEAIKEVRDGHSTLKVFAGQADDPFAVELGGVFDLLAVRKLPGDIGGGVDGLAGYNVQALVLQIPISDLTLDHKVPVEQTSFNPATPVAKNAVIGVWSASYRKAVRAVYNDYDLSALREELSNFYLQLNDDSLLDLNDEELSERLNNSDKFFKGEQKNILKKIAELTKKIRDKENDYDRSDRWVQVSRLGQPLINEVVIPLGLKDRWNSLQPYQDRQFLKYYTNPELATLIDSLLHISVPPQGKPGSGKERDDLVAVLFNGIPGLTKSTALKNPTLSDQLRLNLAVKPSATPSRLGVLGGDLAGYPNGRRLDDDSTDIQLKTVAGVVYPIFHPTYTPHPLAARLGDGVDNNDLVFRGTFPYLALPPSGFGSRPHISQKILDALLALPTSVKTAVQHIIDMLQ